jgi:hypothetical protein
MSDVDVQRLLHEVETLKSRVDGLTKSIGELFNRLGMLEGKQTLGSRQILKG